MSPKIDPAILSALSLTPSPSPSLSLTPHGSSSFIQSYRLTTPTTTLFIKTSSSPSAQTMFHGEHTSLNAIHSAVPSLSPRSLAWGPLSNSNGFFLITEFLDLHGRSNTTSGESLARKLATLHSTPPPPDHANLGFGFPVPTSCGDTVQDNSWRPTWAVFFGECRMLHILKCAEEKHGVDRQLRSLIEETVEKVIPRLLGEGHLGGADGVNPVVTHGDLWSGNKGVATFPGRSSLSSSQSVPSTVTAEHVVFDPSSAYCHFEYDHGIMTMFGGFSNSFWTEYWGYIDKAEPVGEYEDRVALYRSYHQLNHYVMFGGGYRGGAMGILRGLIGRYG